MKLTSLILVSAALAMPVFAQVPAPPATPKPIVPAPVAPNPQPAAVPVPGAGNPAAAQVKKHDPNALAAKDGVPIDGSNWDDQGVADAYTAYTGKRVLLSSATQNMEIRFYQKGPLTNRQAADLLVKVLDMEGYVFVPSGPNEVKLLAKAQNASVDAPGSYPNELIHNPEDLPKGDQYASYFMKMKFIKPEDAIRIFTQSVNALDAGTKIAPVPNAAGIIITSRASFIRKLINQKQVIDVSAGVKDTVWVQMKYADAEEVAASLNEIMNAQQQRRTTAGVTTARTTRTSGNRPPVPGGRAPQVTIQSGGATAAGEDIPVHIVGYPRLNKIFIMGRPMDIVFVEGLARQFDAPPTANSFIKRKLRFMIASDFLDVASNALEAAAGPSASGAGGRQNGGRGGRQTTQNRNQPTQNRNQGGAGGGGGETVQEFNVSDVPESIVVGKTFIVADNLANSVLVQGPPESLRIVSELIDKLDGRPQQVMISTVFGQLNLNKTNEFGISGGRTVDAGGNSSAAGLLNNGIGAILDTESLGTIGSIPQGDGTAGLNIYGRVGNYQLLMRALNSNTNFKVLSRPTVFTANNRRAVISSGQRVAVPTNTFQSGANTGQTQSTNIEFRDVVLRLEVVPLINSEDEVTLRISLLNDQIVGEQIIDGNSIPTIGTEEISTTVTIPNESTVVLGGLVTERDEKSRSGVPILSSIPGIGRLFSRTETSKDRRELLIFIRPEIVSGKESLNRVESDIEGAFDVAKPTREFGDSGVLPKRSKKSKSVAPRKQSSKKSIPAVSKRPYLRYPTRR